jgi:tetratricopeptide (TPR) repeat protein
LETNVKGEFKTLYELDNKRYTRLVVDVVAAKPGYTGARESAEFQAKEGTREVRLVLRDVHAPSEQLSLATLMDGLAPRLRAPTGRSAMPDAIAKDYQQGLEQLFEKHDAARAAQTHRKVVERQPDCTRCRVALALALLDEGSWANVVNQLLAAAGPATQPTASAEAADAFLVLGVLDAWAEQPSTALGYFFKALEARPEDPLVLQEMGRALMAQQNWAAAEEHLERALRAGATSEARALRVRALLESGDTAEAEAEMNALLAGRSPRDLPAPLRMLYARLQERLQLQAYSAVKSVVDQPIENLTRAMPELQGLEPAADQDQLSQLLIHVGQTVEGFFRSLPNTSSVEAIREEILSKDGKVRETHDEKFLYLLVMRPEEMPPGMNEYRTRAEMPASTAETLKRGFMRTSGFACTSLNFHTSHQSGASYRLLGRQEMDGQPTYVIAFAQRPETAQRIGRFDFDGKSVPVLVQGIAWVDIKTWQIIRMRTDLLKPPPNTRLRRQTTEIQFGEVRFKEIATPLWLPREVTVTVEWKGKTFRNLHRYSDFKVFRVETEERRRAEGRRVPRDPHRAIGLYDLASRLPN